MPSRKYSTNPRAGRDARPYDVPQIHNNGLSETAKPYKSNAYRYCGDYAFFFLAMLYKSSADNTQITIQEIYMLL